MPCEQHWLTFNLTYNQNTAKLLIQMDPISIVYHIKLNDELTETFRFNLDSQTSDLILSDTPSPPPWTELKYKQCSHCPLDSSEHSHCPIALQLYNIIDRFHETSSIDEVELKVVTEERTISQPVSLQRAIGSMLGLVSPTCGCPKMAYMKPMARFHLPLSSEEETAFRVTGMYLLAQNFLRKNDEDFEGLKTIYADFHILNKAIASRLRTATESDSSKNAIALLDMYSNLVPMMIEDQLTELQHLFTAFLPEGKTDFPASQPKLELADPEATDYSGGKKESGADSIEKTNDKEFESELSSLLNGDSDKPTLSLAPIDGLSIETDSNTTGKATFKLPDD